MGPFAAELLNAFSVGDSVAASLVTLLYASLIHTCVLMKRDENAAAKLFCFQIYATAAYLFTKGSFSGACLTLLFFSVTSGILHGRQALAVAPALVCLAAGGAALAYPDQTSEAVFLVPACVGLSICLQVGVHAFVSSVDSAFKNAETSHNYLEKIRLELLGENIRFQEELSKSRKFQDSLRQAQKMQAIGTLASGIAHDFNNILGAIIGYAEMAECELEEKGTESDDLQQIIKAGTRAKELVQQILAFSRQHKQERKPLALHQVVKEALKLLRASLPTTIKIDKRIQAGEDVVLADFTQVHQVLMNLCTNAHHAMHQNGGTLSVVVKPVDLNESEAVHISSDMLPGSYVLLKVSDTGCGMDMEVKQRIFEPYFSTKEKGVGTGLGMAVVHSIVEQHGGVITVESQKGEGSTFTIYFPRLEKKIQPDERIESALPRGEEKILFVDDEEMLAELGKTMLEHFGYHVTAVCSPLNALELFRQDPTAYDLVISDLTMPDLPGKLLAAKIMEIRKGIPIILCTGFSEDFSEHEAKAVGAKAFIMKPLAMNTLAKTVRRVLDECRISISG